MSGDPTKTTLDPIPVSGPPRPELPKVPDLPALAALPSLPPKPMPVPVPPAVEPAVAPAPLPALPMATWLPASMREYLRPTRTKGVVAAGVLSLIGGASVMRYLWPTKPAATAQHEPEQKAPLLQPPGEATQAEPPQPKPIEPPLVKPLTDGVFPPIVAGLPKSEPLAGSLPAPPTMPALPSISEVPSGDKLTIPPLGLPPTISTPAITTVRATDAVPPLKLTELTVAGGPPATPAAPTTPPAKTDAPMPLPIINLGTPPAPSAGKIDPPTTTPPTGTLPLPGLSDPPKAEIKIDPPKLEGSPVPPIPVLGPPKLADVAPKPDPVAMPKIELAPMPKIEAAPPTLKLEGLPTPKVEPIPTTPKLDAVPASRSADPLPMTTAAKTDYDVDLHYVKGGDSWTAVSKQYYGDERYSDALKAFNQNANLTQLQRAEVPPIHVLRKGFATLIAKPAEKPQEWAPISQSGATDRIVTEPRKATGGGMKVYTIPVGGRSIKDVAADAYGDEGLWGTVWESNPKLTPDKLIPEGTKVYLTSKSKIGE